MSSVPCLNAFLHDISDSYFCENTEKILKLSEQMGQRKKMPSNLGINTSCVMSQLWKGHGNGAEGNWAEVNMLNSFFSFLPTCPSCQSACCWNKDGKQIWLPLSPGGE